MVLRRCGSKISKHFNISRTNRFFLRESLVTVNTWAKNAILNLVLARVSEDCLSFTF